MDLDRGGGFAIKSPTDGSEPSHPPPPPVASMDSAACPRLVLLPCFAERTDDHATTTSVSVSSCTSTGRRFRVSFGLVPSPGISSFFYTWDDQDPADGRHGRVQCPILLAAHRDCILIEVTTPYTYTTVSPSPPPDYFIMYQASATAGRWPSLMLLPPCYIPNYYDRPRFGESPPVLQSTGRHMLKDVTAVLRRGEEDDDDILVAQLEQPGEEQGELCLLRPGRDPEWQLKKMPIVFDNDKGSRVDECQQAQNYDDNNPLTLWSTDAAFTVGDRYLCWVDYLRGFLFIDMGTDDEWSLRLRYTPLPVEPPSGNPHAGEWGRSNMASTRNLAAAGDGSVRFVHVESRCCCGDPGRTSCEAGRFLFTVTTWSLNLSMDDEPMEWVKDGVLDCDELWAQPGYTGLPHVTVQYPVVVDSNDPDDAVCFVVSTDYRNYSMVSVDKKVWTIMVDTRQKVLRSVVPFIGSELHHPRSSFFPAEIQY